ncbi:hypothetical protein B0A48_18653 [Cryoendolithus antarcticus]|uniref:YTH domain-containing protein n=1 Tax=Cryoendolithus antarcticus TaxID=1507870 RepID=A0A1V8S8P7_9PEZI|nr:hypothetical protein B0A48_18653 [Cryoendolithus antarcticus]
MHRFHDSRFNGNRLVPASTPALTHSGSPDSEQERPRTPTIVGGPFARLLAKTEPSHVDSALKGPRIPEAFFILKSLTSRDLETSVCRGEWTTQVHNEAALNIAFERAKNVYLVFSANKSGEYFGYARMLAPISEDLSAIKWSAMSGHFPPADGPRFIPTTATATAPSGRIFDDSARGTIFWEADDVVQEDGSELMEQSSDDSTTAQDLARPFKIVWISTTRLPFFRTRGLRNAWNDNREVKIARDGTELEPTVGRKLMQSFHVVGQ